jgi:hypothetical protein
LDSTKIPKKSEDLKVRDEGDNVYVLYNAKDGKVRIMNITGKRILELCDGTHTASDIVSRLVQELSPANPEECLKDVEEFLSELEGKELIEWV